MADLLTLFRRSGIVRDGNLLDSFSHTAKLRGYFRTEFKAPALQPQLCQRRTPKDLIAGGLVVNAGGVEKIREMRQQLCAEKKTQPAIGAIGSHPVHHIRFSQLQWP
jgi:hypothetical protein